jgi:hypothetical protein
MARKPVAPVPTQVAVTGRVANATANIQERKPGPGRPKGSVNKSTLAVRDFFRKIFEDEGYRKNVAAIIKRFDPDEMKKIMPVWILGMHYVYGRPKATIALELPKPETPLTDGLTRQERRELYELLRRGRTRVVDGQVLEMKQVAYEPEALLPGGES